MCLCFAVSSRRQEPKQEVKDVETPQEVSSLLNINLLITLFIFVGSSDGVVRRRTIVTWICSPTVCFLKVASRLLIHEAVLSLRSTLEVLN